MASFTSDNAVGLLIIRAPREMLDIIMSNIKQLDVPEPTKEKTTKTTPKYQTRYFPVESASIPEVVQAIERLLI